MNTRQFPRTLNEAFPQTVDYASSIERSRGYPRAWWVLMALCAVAAVWVIV